MKKIHYILFSGLLLLVILSRWFFMNDVSSDFTYAFEPWANYIREHGVFDAFKDNFSNYTPPYLHIMSLGVGLNFNMLYYLKVLAFIFEALTAYYVFKIIRIKYSYEYALYAALFFLLIPTVILNGARWAQSDIIYTGFIIMALYYLLTERIVYTILFFGIAYAFKQQAVFVFPFLLLWVLTKRVPLHYLLLFPMPFLLSLIPSILAGKDPGSALLVYINQDYEFVNRLSINAATFYNFFTIDDNNFYFFKVGGVLFTGILVLLSMFVIYKRKILNKENAIKIILLFSIFVPFFLPRMHERYFMIAECLSVLYVFYYREQFYLPLLIIFPTTITYLNYFGMEPLLSLKGCSFLMLGGLIISGCSVFYLNRNKEVEQIE